jgi:hypothetical protein
MTYRRVQRGDRRIPAESINAPQEAVEGLRDFSAEGAGLDFGVPTFPPWVRPMFPARITGASSDFPVKYSWAKTYEPPGAPAPPPAAPPPPSPAGLSEGILLPGGSAPPAPAADTSGALTSTPTWYDDLHGGPLYDVYSLPAYEIGDNPKVPIGAKVELWPSNGGECLFFFYPPGASALTGGNPNNPPVTPLPPGTTLEGGLLLYGGLDVQGGLAITPAQPPGTFSLTTTESVPNTTGFTYTLALTETTPTGLRTGTTTPVTVNLREAISQNSGVTFTYTITSNQTLHNLFLTQNNQSLPTGLTATVVSNLQTGIATVNTPGQQPLQVAISTTTVQYTLTMTATQTTLTESISVPPTAGTPASPTLPAGFIPQPGPKPITVLPPGATTTTTTTIPGVPVQTGPAGGSTWTVSGPAAGITVTVQTTDPTQPPATTNPAPTGLNYLIQVTETGPGTMTITVTITDPVTGKPFCTFPFQAPANTGPGGLPAPIGPPQKVPWVSVPVYGVPVFTPQNPPPVLYPLGPNGHLPPPGAYVPGGGGPPVDGPGSTPPKQPPAFNPTAAVAAGAVVGGALTVPQIPNPTQAATSVTGGTGATGTYTVSYVWCIQDTNGGTTNGSPPLTAASVPVPAPNAPQVITVPAPSTGTLGTLLQVTSQIVLYRTTPNTTGLPNGPIATAAIPAPGQSATLLDIGQGLIAVGALTSPPTGNTTGAAAIAALTGVNVVLQPAPGVAPNVNPVGVQGATTYQYAVTKFDGTGETPPSPPGSTAVGNASLANGNGNLVDWLDDGTHPTGWNLYRLAGGPSQGKIGTVLWGNPTVFLDGGGAASGAVPVSNTTGGIIVGGPVVQSADAAPPASLLGNGQWMDFLTGVGAGAALGITGKDTGGNSFTTSYPLAPPANGKIPIGNGSGFVEGIVTSADGSVAVTNTAGNIDLSVPAVAGGIKSISATVSHTSYTGFAGFHSASVTALTVPAGAVLLGSVMHRTATWADATPGDNITATASATSGGLNSGFRLDSAGTVDWNSYDAQWQNAAGAGNPVGVQILTTTDTLDHLSAGTLKITVYYVQP